MARPIEFDVNNAIANAMHAYWIHGVTTTISDIEAATNLNRSSIYNTIGDKDEIFRLVHHAYNEYLSDWIIKTFSHLSFKDFLKEVLFDAATDNFEGRGCFFYNCVGESASLNLKKKIVLEESYIHIKNIFIERLLLAQKNKELLQKINLNTYASLLLVTISGLRAFNLSGAPKDDLIDVAQLALVQLSTLISKT